MIHYHGGPITPLSVAHATWARRHACVSFARPEQTALAMEICQSVIFDNGAFTLWSVGGVLDIVALWAWVQQWCRHPGFDGVFGPDDIAGDERANDAMLDRWLTLAAMHHSMTVPVWHLHESYDRLARLCRDFPRVALGSSGAWATVGTPSWWQRIGGAMDAICDEDGRPPCKLHGLRMLNPRVFSRLPLASADSTNVAQNHGRERKLYALTPAMGALAIVDRIEAHASASCWRSVAEPLLDFGLVG